MKLYFNQCVLMGGLGFLSVMLPITSWSAKLSAKEAAISHTADDKDLKWGPAPAFLPQGSELAVLHGDPSKRNADILLRIPSKGVIPSHWHTSAERMILVSGEMRVTYEGQAPTLLKAGMYAYGPAKQRHDGVCESSTPCVLFVAFEAPVDAVPVTK